MSLFAEKCCSRARLCRISNRRTRSCKGAEQGVGGRWEGNRTGKPSPTCIGQRRPQAAAAASSNNRERVSRAYRATRQPATVQPRIGGVSEKNHAVQTVRVALSWQCVAVCEDDSSEETGSGRGIIRDGRARSAPTCRPTQPTEQPIARTRPGTCQTNKCVAVCQA